MNRLSLHLCKLVLPGVLARACGASSIPRSGPDGARVNCYITAIDKGEQPYLVVLGATGNELTCLEWNGSRYENQRQFPLASFNLADFQITHYYGLSEIRFKGIVDFLLNRLLGWPYAKIHVARWLDSVDQYLFNKKKLITKQRMVLLKLLVEKTLEGKPDHDSVDLMTDLYSIRWVLHPQGEDQMGRLAFFLDSLVDTGELKMVNHRYVVTGHALRTIEEYEEQERRHTENVKMQWRMFWLAVTVAALTVVQAGLVKLPALIDFTTK